MTKGSINELKQSLGNLSPQGSTFRPPDTSDLESALGKKNLSSADRIVGNMSEDVLRQRREEERLYRERRIGQQEAVQENRQRKAQLSSEISDIDKMIRFTEKRKDIDSAQIKTAVDGFNKTRGAKEWELNNTKDFIKATEDKIKLEEKGHSLRMDDYEDAMHATKRLSGSIKDLNDNRKLSLLFHVGDSGSLARGLQNFGRTKLAGSLPSA